MTENEQAVITEWRAWRSLCKELDALGVDVNADPADQAVKAIKRWGEELVDLRISQDEHIRDEALNETRGQYPELVQ